MQTTITAYYELSAPAATVRDLLCDPQMWATLPLPATRHGTYWQAGDDLYAVQPAPEAASDPATLRYTVTPVLPHLPRLVLELILHDAVIATHVQVRLTQHTPGRGVLWRVQQAMTRRRLQRTLDACAQQMQAQVWQQQQAQVPPVPTDDRLPLAERLQARYPQTVAHFAAMGASDHLERVYWLERNWARILRGDTHSDLYAHAPADVPAPPADYDLIYAGGGMGLLHAALMAQRYGRRVLLFDRSTVGSVHREWNISHGELQALVRAGVLDERDLAEVVMNSYRNGVVYFHNGDASRVPYSELWLPDVLNVALDAGALLRVMRRRLEAAGGVVLDGHAFDGVCVYGTAGKNGNGTPAVAVSLRDIASGDVRRVTGRLLLDGMGSTSPLALLRHRGEPFAGVCPTVGTVVSGIVPGSAPHEFDPTIGDILLSVSDTQMGRQMIWEGFPGRGDELTVYLFYYVALRHAGRDYEPPPPPANGGEAPPRYSLLELFEHYFALLPTYKRPGEHFAHHKPVYGYIPGRHNVRRHDAPMLAGVLPVGDAAAQQSPLTFCGFGSHVRNLHRTASLLDYALQHDLLTPPHLKHVTAYQTNVSLNWVFSRFMQPWGTPQGVNELQNAFLAAMNELGIDLATRFFRDETRWHDYNRVVWRTMMHYPDVFRLAFLVLGVPGVVQWARDYARFSGVAATATAARLAGAPAERALGWLTARLAPGVGLAVRASYAEWRAMGWLPRDA